MHTFINLPLLIGGIFVLLAGGYAFYWNLTIHRALANRFLKGRVAWTAVLVLVLIIFLGVWAVAQNFHIIRPEVGATMSVWVLLRNLMLTLSYAAGNYTMNVALKHRFARERFRVTERLVQALSPVVWPWIFLSFGLSFLSIFIVEPVLTTATQLVLPLVSLLFFWPVIIAAMVSARRWVPDFPLRQNMKWYVYLVVSIAFTVWTGYLVINIFHIRAVLGLQPLGPLIATIFFPAVIYTAYRSSKSLVLTHRLPPMTP